MRTVATAFAERAKMDWTSRLQMEVAVAAQKLAQAWDGVGYTAEEREQLTQVRDANGVPPHGLPTGCSRRHMPCAKWAWPRQSIKAAMIAILDNELAAAEAKRAELVKEIKVLQTEIDQLLMRLGEDKGAAETAAGESPASLLHQAEALRSRHAYLDQVQFGVNWRTIHDDETHWYHALRLLVGSCGLCRKPRHAGRHWISCGRRPTPS